MLHLLPFAAAVILKALIGATVVAAIAVALLSWDLVYTWLQERQHLLKHSPNVVAASIKEKLETGKIRHVTAFFDRKTGIVLDHQIVDADRLDPELEAIHRGVDAVIYKG